MQAYAGQPNALSYATCRPQKHDPSRCSSVALTTAGAVVLWFLSLVVADLVIAIVALPIHTVIHAVS